MSRTLDAALAYRRTRGWQPVLIRPGSKRPQLGAWQKLRPTDDELRTWFARPANVGIALGEPSGWLVDVDIDAPDALPLAPRFLPITTVFGRASKPRSHWLYTAPGARTLQLKDDAAAMIVELRSTGAQTVMPPSVHVSGEPIEWSTPSDAVSLPQEIAAAPLADKVARLALAVLNVREGMAADDAVAAALAEQPPEPEPRRPGARAVNLPVTTSASVVERARRYVSKMPPAIDGAGGSLATLNVAAVLVKGFALPEDVALDVLLTDYNPRCRGPWSEKELRHKLESALRGPRQLGYLLEGRR